LTADETGINRYFDFQQRFGVFWPDNGREGVPPMNVRSDAVPEAGTAVGPGEACYRAIRGDILHGRLAPRTRLRIERLRDHYGASISTLRETLSRLAGEGLVAVEGHRGFAVAPLTRDEFRDLADLRLLLETHAIDRSFACGDLEWEGLVVGAHHKLARIEDAMLAGGRDRADLWKHYDKAFHQALIAACGSAELAEAHGGIFDRYLRYQIVAMIFRGAVAAEQHRALRDAALRRDAGEARATLRRHIEGCVEDTLESDRLEDAPAAAPAAPAAVRDGGTVGEKAWLRLREDIVSGRLGPGQRLRLEVLRGEYGFGISTLREVLNRLATEGLVRAEGQRGFEVAPISRHDLREIADLRLLVETHAMAASFRNGGIEWEARVVAAYHRLAAMEARMEGGDASATDQWKRYDWEFHQALIAACGSVALMQLHGLVFDKYLRYQRLALSFRRKVAAGEHRALLDHALRRDVPAARRLLKLHLEGGVAHALASGRI
jgi:DNA-binding GntR family transcriptional regulator